MKKKKSDSQAIQEPFKEEIAVSSCETQLLKQSNHRERVAYCPSCNYEFKRTEEYDLAASFASWFKPSVLREVILEPEIHFKEDTVVAVSQCPKCGEHSWVHIDSDRLLYYYNKEGEFGYNEYLAGKLEELIKKKK